VSDLGTAAPIFCAKCGREIELPGQFVIYGPDRFHTGCHPVSAPWPTPTAAEAEITRLRSRVAELEAERSNAADAADEFEKRVSELEGENERLAVLAKTHGDNWNIALEQRNIQIARASAAEAEVAAKQDLLDRADKIQASLAAEVTKLRAALEPLVARTLEYVGEAEISEQLECDAEMRALALAGRAALTVPVPSGEKTTAPKE
jgi:hypothetical protein